jgi:formyltetrahydrofolate deformylase
MVFLGHCPDSVGLVAKISGFFAEKNLNIFQMKEHTERGQFFIRIQSTGFTSEAELNDFSQKFSALAKEIQMTWKIFDEEKKVKVVLFCSDTLPTPLEIITGEISGSLPIEVVHIISNSEKIKPIAEKFTIPFSYIPTPKKTGNNPEKNKISGLFEHEKKHLEILEKIKNTGGYDGMVLARYMKILSENFLEKITKPIINIHHSFLPSFIGGKPYEMAYERGVKLIGATAHFVTKDLDEGPIIAQDVLHIGHKFSLEEMKREGANIEKKVLASALLKFAQYKIIEFKGRTIVFE